MAGRNFVRRFTPSRIEHFEWLVYEGYDCAREHRVSMSVPDENYVRRLLRIPDNVPILIGRP